MLATFFTAAFPGFASAQQTPPASERTFAEFLAAAQDSAEASAPSPAESESGAGEPEQATPDILAGPKLTLADVIASVYRSYPEINRARQEMAVAGGELQSAYGAYDTKFEAMSVSEPTGFYRNYRNGLGVSRQTWWGGYMSAGYRIGRGFFQPWYKERQTNDAGEFKVSLSRPLLQGRAIDPERVAVFQRSIAQQAVEPQVQRTILEISRDATMTYWDWISAGSILVAQRELLNLALTRGEQLRAGVEAGLFAEIDVVLNRQLIAEREVKVLQAEQKFRSTSFKLGLYVRDAAGDPLVPDDAWLPNVFPAIEQPPPIDFAAELAAALSRRPEPRLFEFELRHVGLDRQLARNQMLPKIDFVVDASQDVGEPSTKSDDKGEFELVVGFMTEVPMQQRKARGKIQSSNAKMAQINEKLRLTRDKISAELLTAINALNLSYQAVEQSELSLRAAIETLTSYQFAFDRGKIDLIYLNLLETKANETEIKLIDAQRAWFGALASLQTALGLDPLETALEVTELPASQMPGPGNLPETEALPVPAVPQN